MRLKGTTSAVIARSEATKQSILPFARRDGACHRARVRATRWLAMTVNRLLKRAALLYRAPNQQGFGGYHEDDLRQACRDAVGAVSDIRSGGRAKQDHGRHRRRRLPVLSADGAGEATRRIRQGWPCRRTGRSE